MVTINHKGLLGPLGFTLGEILEVIHNPQPNPPHQQKIPIDSKKHPLCKNNACYNSRNTFEPCPITLDHKDEDWTQERIGKIADT